MPNTHNGVCKGKAVVKQNTKAKSSLVMALMMPHRLYPFGFQVVQSEFSTSTKSLFRNQLPIITGLN